MQFLNYVSQIKHFMSKEITTMNFEFIRNKEKTKNRTIS